MNMRHEVDRGWLLIAALVASLASAAQALTVSDLRCEYRQEPLGIDVAQPRLSWLLHSDRQTAYQVVVKGAWDSGKVVSDQSIGVAYTGATLLPGSGYEWKVRVWDGADKPSAWSKPARFTTGLREWQAKWIGAQEGSPGVLGYAVEARRADETKWVQVDLGAMRTIERVVLLPQVHNDPAAGGWIQGYGFPLRFRVEVSDDPAFVKPTTVADKSDADFPNPGPSPVSFDAGRKPGRYVRLTVTKLWHRGQDLPHVFTLAELEVWSGGTNIALKMPVTANDSVECCGWSRTHLTDGIYSQPAPPGLEEYPHAAILLRKECTLAKPVKRAIVYMSGLGWSELTLNGQKVGDAVLSPEFTDYDKRVPYVVHDVTGKLKRGGNAIGVTLGNGFSATPGLGYLSWFGNAGAPRLLFQLNIEFADGTQESVVSDASWKWSTGEITFNDLWAGERLDARLAKRNWDRTGFNDGDWHPVLLVGAPRGKLFARTIPPIRVLETEEPAKIEGNRFYFDTLGAGWLRLKVAGKEGDKVIVNYRTNPAETATNVRRISTECILRGGGEEVFEPKFLFHTLDRVVSVEGLRQPPTRKTLTRCSAQIDLRRTGRFECSNEFLNRQYQALLRTQRNYNYDYPMDPTREKSGWTQDVMTMIHSSLYDFDAAAFYWNWWQDMRDNQRPDGYLGSVVPLANRVLDDCNCVWWNGMIVYTPWYLYEYYGDQRFLEESYPAMVAYLRWLATKADKDQVISWGLGDWLEVGATSSPKRTAVPITSTCGYYLYATILSRTAAILGRTDESAQYAKLAAEIKDGFNRRFLNPQTGQVGNNPDTQTAQILPLYLDMIPSDKRQIVLDRLVANIHERKDHLSTGFIGTLHLLLGLPDLGHGELTHKIVMQQDFPGWNTLVRDGVQMETWAGGQVQMPSLGGPMGAYLYQVLAGIRPGAPGFKHIVIQPSVVGDLTWVKAQLDSPYGLIKSHWKRVGNKVTMDIDIPANTTASIRVPGTSSVHAVGPGHHRFQSTLPQSAGDVNEGK
jgi:alpha-L-rhamnosidase